MKVKSVCIEFSRKYNLGDYEAVEAQAFFSAQVDEDEDDERVALFLIQKAKDAVASAVEEELNNSAYQQGKAKVTRTFAGKTVETPLDEF